MASGAALIPRALPWLPTILVLSACAPAGAGTADVLPPWKYRGYEAFPALFFGAQNGSRTMDPLEPDSNLEWITKHQLAGYGWQHAIGVMKEESVLHQVAKQTKAYASVRGREVTTFVYRDAQCADKEYVLAASVLRDPAKDHWFLRSPNGTVCERQGQWPGQRQFNFSVPEVRDWYIDVVIAEVAAEDGVDVVFFDETDWTFHHYPWGQFKNCPGFEPFTTDVAWAAYREAKADLLARTVLALNRAGKVPLFSASGSTTANSDAAHCPNNVGHWPEEDYLASIRARSQGGVYFRFYESWMGFGNTNRDCWVNWLLNAIWETAQGLPFTVRWDMGMFGGSDAWLEFGMAAFLMAQGNYSYFGAAANWYDQDWAYRRQYDWKVGAPLGPAVRTAKYRWRRHFELCNVSVDLQSASGNFSWL